MSASRLFKGCVAGRSRRRMTVAALMAGSTAVIELRVLADGKRDAPFIELSLNQTRELVRLLLAAGEAAYARRHDGPQSSHEDRASFGEGQSDGHGTSV